MSYPQPYGQPAQPYQGGPYGGYAPPRKKRGMKRIVFGILGILANGIGLIAMPFIGALIGGIIAAIAMMNATTIDNPGSVTLEAGDMAMVFVPTDEVASTTCDISADAPEIQVEPASPPPLEIEINGTSYTEVAQVTGSTSTSEVSVSCPGASSVAYGTGSGWLVLISGGIGLVIPIVLGLLAFSLLIWGIVARVRS